MVEVLEELGVDAASEETAIIEVWNKIDLLGEAARESCLNETALQSDRLVGVSAISGQGMPELLALIENRLTEKFSKIHLSVAPEDGALMHWILEHTQLVSRQTIEETGFCDLVVRGSSQIMGQLENRRAGLRTKKLL